MPLVGTRRQHPVEAFRMKMMSGKKTGESRPAKWATTQNKVVEDLSLSEFAFCEGSGAHPNYPSPP